LLEEKAYKPQMSFYFPVFHFYDHDYNESEVD